MKNKHCVFGIASYYGITGRRRMQCPLRDLCLRDCTMKEVLLNEPENPAPYHNKLLEIFERIKNRKVKLYYIYHERSSPRRKYRIQTTSKDISLNLTQFEPHEVDDLVEFLECKQAEHRGEDFLLVYTHEGKAVKSIIVSTKLIDRSPDYMVFTLR